MLLNELLIKIGFDADSQAMQQFEQLLNTLEQGANGAAEQLGDFAKAIEDVAKEAVEQAKEMPEFSEFFKSLDDLQEKTKDLSQDEALDAWVQKILESDELLSGFGEDFTTNAQELEQGLVSLGLSSEDVEKVIVKLKDAIEKKQKTTEHDTKSTQENTEAQKDNAQSAGNLADKMIALWATKYGADGLIQKFELLGISISKTTLKFVAFGAAFYAATIGVKNFVDNNLDALNEIKQLSAVTGEAADQIYKLGKVAEVNGSSSQAVQASIEGLSRTIGEAAAGIGRGAKYFEQYGLSAKKANGDVKTSSEILGEISDKMKKMGEQEQIAMLAKLGIDGSMIQLLRLGNDELREQIELADKLTLGVGNAENAKTAAAFKDNMTQLTQVFTAMGEYLSLRIAPAISRIIERFTKWFSENNDLIKAILNGFGRVFSFLFELAGAIDNVVSNTIGWRTVIYTLGAALLWLSRRMILAFATNPITLVLAAISAVFLLVDDFIGYLEGNETALGEFWKPFKSALLWVKTTWQNFIDNFTVDPIGSTLSLVTNMIELPFKLGLALVVGLWNLFTGQQLDLDVIEKGFAKVTDWIKKPFQSAFDWVKGYYDEYIGPIIDTVKDWFGSSGTGKVSENTKAYDAMMFDPNYYATAPQVAAAGLGQGTSNADNSIKNSNNKITITQNIQGADNPKIVADQSARAISNQLSPIVG
ncbi:tail length tape measure protein [Aggregatibacter actinomycetemcomitans]|uniref:Tail length tape measure protein n=2 Tax=Aggregatibacter actinomycetemcomitans TaxID=714 RepID=A0A5D0EJH1_AGGAC|nr:tail length tape measure protein [Aggregatibacter actinomycetemcomitans]NP_852768.1 tail length tape measure protein [Haemophilus phage Aaphi23]AMQ94638.1 tail length tape measure protein [Aggregatibacter actinomycetemcomitans]MCE3057980.1 tail length tape measure protein [Aggregatibacter actinomycetemcomitans]TYA21688.1 tail length tape measure protein [Aggregatibacter actinomycetemcomitans]TYA34464.1 tail length tape measure protein [Aggregatibacter actinomycetemcomitans]TYA39516.1 tail 